MFNRKMKKAASMVLAGTMVLSMTACGGGNDEPKSTPTPAAKPSEGANKPADDNNNPDDGQGDTNPGGTTTSQVAPHAGSTPRKIRIGTWYDQFYDSRHTDIYDNPEVNNPETATMMLQAVRDVEEKYNVEIEYVNLTWEGAIESINTSIMAGTPDCDVYQVDLQFGVPAILNNYATGLEDFLPADADIFTDQTVFKYLSIDGVDKSYLFTGSALDCGACLLGFNMDMIDEAGLENPQDLYDRGEWTWEKFREYCRALTKDTDGDTINDQWGYSGWFNTAFSYLCMSNGTHVAGGKQEMLSSPATIEVLDFMYQLYQVDKTARPFDYEDWNINVTAYTSGKIGFWTTYTWVQSGNGLSSDVGYEIGMVPWPIGPNGNQETNSQVAVAGNWYMIPAGVERPELVYAVLEDYSNWYKGDLSYRDDTEWHEDKCETERNWEYLKKAGQTTPWFDLWDKITDFNAPQDVINPDGDSASTAAQAAEQYKQLVQDFLDTYLN